jgi:hypothetical protein
MDNRGQVSSVLKLVNQARAAYGAPELETLLSGQPHSVSFCPIGRSLRSGVEEWLFVALGSKHLRLWAPGNDSAAVARLIMTAWGMPHLPMVQPRDKSGCMTLALPAAICDFVNQFDRGLLPDYEREAGQSEMRQLSELARAMPILVGQRNSLGGLREVESESKKEFPVEDQALRSQERRNVLLKIVEV